MRLDCDILLNDLFPLAGALANYLTLIQPLCVCHPHISHVGLADMAAKLTADMCGLHDE